MPPHLHPSELDDSRAGGASADPSRRRIAIVGAGVSGLVSAHLLAERHEVTVFELKQHAGGHAHTVDVPVPEGGTVPVDIGFMVFNERTYPGLTELFSRLGVRTRTSHMSFSVSDGAEFEFAGHSVSALFANRSHVADRAFLQMLREYARFNRQARALMLSDEDPSLREWLEQQRFSTQFIERLLVPQASAVWSADPEQMWTFPARFLVQFFDNHGMLRLLGRPAWKTLVGGSRTYVEAICARLGRDRMRLAAPVERVRCGVDGTELVVGGDVHFFDDVVLACHADDALGLLEDPTPLEAEVLGAFGYQRSELVLHHDERLLPRRRQARASWNYHLIDPAPAAPTLTYDLKRLQGLRTSLPILASLNVTELIDPGKIHATFPLAHPIFTPETVVAQRRHGEISGTRGVHFAGAHWGWGFHEDGFNSAQRVAAQIGTSSSAEAVAA